MIADLDESFSCEVCQHSTISDFSGIVYPKASWGEQHIPSYWEEKGREDMRERKVRGDGNGEEGTFKD